ncbi:hypothetical protein CHS0354_017903 [Potamilus streckersoni]|uniref:Uncharacterized protein n=1 Tax=Potamilus streckersoni TaxID=2493646 RepID=A0AAE0T2N8_9BIVA|nr:hypothetical protein CHS0354_017903 [Potamilus streckersoni]
MTWMVVVYADDDQLEEYRCKQANIGGPKHFEQASLVTFSHSVLSTHRKKNFEQLKKEIKRPLQLLPYCWSQNSSALRSKWRKGPDGTKCSSNQSAFNVIPTTVSPTKRREAKSFPPHLRDNGQGAKPEGTG